MPQPPFTRPGHCRESGFVAVAVLIIAGVIAMFAATYSRSVIVKLRSTGVAESTFVADDVIDSEIDFVIRSHQVGRPAAAGDVKTAALAGRLGAGRPLDGHDLTLDVSDVAGDRTRLLARVLSPEGMGATRLIETARAPVASTVEPDSLPRIQQSVLDDLQNDVALAVHHVTSSTTWQDRDVEGLVVLHDAVELILDDVVIHGSVLSRSAFSGVELGAFSEVSAPRVILRGSSRIVAGSDLEGLAVLLPDGKCTTQSADTRVQLQGDVIAHTLSLGGQGSLRGNVGHVTGSGLGAGYERPGVGRGSATWSPVLDSQGAWETTFLAIVPREVEVDDLQAISDFTFPSRGATSVSGTQATEVGGGP